MSTAPVEENRIGEQPKVQGSKSQRPLTHGKCVEISKGVAGMGTLQPNSPLGKSAGSLLVV